MQRGSFFKANLALLADTQYPKEEVLNLLLGYNPREYIRKDGTRFPVTLSGFIFTEVDGSKLVWGIIEYLSYR
jgi:hypothetical protein